MEWSTFCNKINCILRPYIRPFEVAIEEEKITFKIDGTLYEYTKEEFESFKNEMSKYVFHPFVIADPNSYEVLIDNIDVSRGRFLPSSFEDANGKVLAEDNELHLTYTIRQISDELLWFVIENFEEDRKVYPRLSKQIIDMRTRAM